MISRAAAFVFISLVSAASYAQDRKPLFLDTRPGEDSAVIDVTEITEQYEEAAVEEYRKGVAEARRGNHADAVKRLEAAIKIEPDFFNAHNSLAILYQQLLRYQEAEREYNEAARLNPRSAAPLVNLASLQIQQALAQAEADSRTARGMLNDALVSLNRALEIRPGTALAYYYTGVVYYLTFFFEESEAYFKKALSSGDRIAVVARLGLADVHIQLREWDNAVAQLDAYLAEAPFAPNRAVVRSVRDVVLQRIRGGRK
jgi:tetratricopeptide (TPR) repeat protein